MQLLAIDPGTTESAYLQWDGTNIGCKGIIRNEILIAEFHHWPSGEPLAIEMVASYGMPVGREVFETCVWIGRFMQSYKQNLGISADLIYRRDVKLHHCGNARAKDANIRKALIDRFGHPGTKANPGITYGVKSHLWAAFALAVYAYDKMIK